MGAVFGQALAQGRIVRQGQHAHATGAPQDYIAPHGQAPSGRSGTCLRLTGGSIVHPSASAAWSSAIVTANCDLLFDFFGMVQTLRRSGVACSELVEPRAYPAKITREG